MKGFLQNFFIISILIFSVCSFSFAEDIGEQHEALKRSYFKLKNIDPNASDLTAWNQVISDYKDYIKNGKELNDKVLFEYASLLYDFAQTRHDHKLLDDSRQAFADLTWKFPSSSLSDDAMLKMVEILGIRGASPEALKSAYREIIEKFPKSDGAEIARVRISHPSAFSSTELTNSEEKYREAEVTVTSSSSHLPIVVLDPGHGGEDFGAENELGLFEKDVVLSVALESERIINKAGIARVLLTRRSDIFVPLPERIALANKNNAVLFLSLHNNASPKHNQSGATTYVLDDSSDEASKLLAERENKSAGGSGQNTDLDFIVSDLIQSSKHPNSLLLADVIDKSVMGSVRTLWKNAKSSGIKKAPFYVLVGARMPCSLIELFFVDHEVDGDRLSDPDIRKSIATGIAKGIEVFLRKSRG